MVTFFNILTHILVIGGIIAIFVFIGYMIHISDTALEKGVRIASFATGLLIYIGSQSLGITIPSFLMLSLSTTNPFTIGLLGLLLPSFTGTFVAWYCIRNFYKNEFLAARLIILITTVIAILFGDIYAKAYATGLELERLNLTLLPNLAFISSLSLYVIFNLRKKEKIAGATKKA